MHRTADYRTAMTEFRNIEKEENDPTNFQKIKMYLKNNHFLVPGKNEIFETEHFKVNKYEKFQLDLSKMTDLYISLCCIHVTIHSIGSACN